MVKFYGLVNLGLTLAVGIFCSCAKKPKKDPLKVTKADVAKPAAEITQAAAEKFGKDMDLALRDNNPIRFRKLLDLDEIFYRIFPKDVVDGNRQLSEAKTGWEPAIQQSVYQSLEKVRVEFLRAVKDADGMKARFRLAGQGVNYWDMLLGRNAAGQVCFVDYLDYTSGEFLSDSQRQLMQQMLPGLLSGSGTRPDVAREMRSMKKLAEMVNLMRSGQHAKFLDEYDRLGADLKQQRTIMYLRIGAANQIAAAELQQGKVGFEVYTKAVDEYRVVHATAANIELLSLDYYFFKKEYKKAIEIIDQLERRVGGDPYLNLLRANIYIVSKEAGLAKKHFRSVVESCPWEAKAYLALLGIGLNEKNYPEVTRLMIALEKKTEVKMDINFNGAKEFDPYRSSPEMTKWKAHKLAQ